MSVINVMLQDLDARRAPPAPIPLAVAPEAPEAAEPQRPRTTRWRTHVSVLALVAVLGAGVTWQAGREADAPTAAQAALEARPDSLAGRAPLVEVAAQKPATNARPLQFAHLAPRTAADAASSGDPSTHAGEARLARLAGSERNPAAADASPAVPNTVAVAATAAPVAAPVAAPAAAPAAAPVASAANNATAAAMPAGPAPISATAATASGSTPTAAPAPRIERGTVAASGLPRAEASTRQALVRFHAGDVEAAIGGLRAALAEDPAHVEARQSLAAILIERQDLAAARAVLGDGLALNPRQPALAQLGAQVALRLGDRDGAIRILQGAATDNAPAEVHATLGGLLSRARRDREAIGHWLMAVRRAPQPAWWLGLAVALDADGRADEAAEAYDRALASGRLAAESAEFARERLARLR